MRTETVSMDHRGATEDYALVLAGMREELEAAGADLGPHIDGDGCDFELAVVWRCRACGRQQWHPVANAQQ